jgi:hypothetical protein
MPREDSLAALPWVFDCEVPAHFSTTSFPTPTPLRRDAERADIRGGTQNNGEETKS